MSAPPELSGTGPAHREPATADDDAPWQRLDVRTVAVTAVVFTGIAVLGGVPTTIGVGSATSVGTALAWVLPGAGLLIGVATLTDYVRWRRTRYRVTATHVEVRTGVLFTSRLRLARERIRAVDLSAHILLRWLGLVRLAVGTGEQGGGGAASQTLVLNPVPRGEGERLQEMLLDRDVAGSDSRDARRLATWRARWVWYAPLSLWTMGIAAVLIGVAFQVTDWFGRGDLIVRVVLDLAATHGWGRVIAVGLLLVLVVAAVTAIAFQLEAWWDYRLDRERGGMLRVRRGLLTSRSVSLEEDRIRGVDMVEPLGGRLAGAARVQVVATGLGSQAEAQTGLSTLLPLAPRAVAQQIVREIIGPPAHEVSLHPHPRGALIRRLRWAGWIILALVLGWVGLFALGPVPVWALAGAAVLVVVLIVASLRHAYDAASNLGHALTPAVLASRRGSIRRSTVVLHREGIIGWQVRQSIFQRRLGLATLVAVTAAGRGRYPVVDGSVAQIQELADQEMVGLLAPRGEGSGAGAPDGGAPG